MSLSFKELTPDVLDELIKEYPQYSEELSEMLFGLLDLYRDGVTPAVSVLDSILFVRIFDEGVYSFISPIPLSDVADIRRALLLIRDYAVREMLPLVFTDVPREDITVYSNVFKLPNVRVYDDDDDLFFVRCATECDGVTELPNIYGERVALKPIFDIDATQYARLCKDKEVNRYWGYDADVDNVTGSDEFYLSLAKDEFERGVAITLGAYLQDSFIGEGVLYGFDFSGGASLGVRLLPEYQGRGFGSEIMTMLVSFAREIGLDYLTCEVLLENKASIKMTEKIFGLGLRDSDRNKYRISL